MWQTIQETNTGQQYLVQGGVAKVLSVDFDQEGFIKARLLATHTANNRITRTLHVLTVEDEDVARTLADAYRDAATIEFRAQIWPNARAPRGARLEDLVIAEQCDAYLVSANVVEMRKGNPTVTRQNRTNNIAGAATVK